MVGVQTKLGHLPELRKMHCLKYKAHVQFTSRCLWTEMGLL